MASFFFKAFKDPLSWLFGLFLFLSELVLFGVCDITGSGDVYSASSHMVYHACALVTCAASLVWSARGHSSLEREEWLTGFEVIAVAFGVIILLASQDSANRNIFAAIGCGAVACGTYLMFLQVQCFLITTPLDRLKPALCSGATIEALLLVAYPAIFPFASRVVVVLATIVGALLTRMIKKRREGECDQLQTKPATDRPRAKAMWSRALPLVAGEAAIVIGWSFLQTQAYSQDPWALTFLFASTKLLAVALFIALLARLHDLQFSTSGKFICVMITCAGVLQLVAANPYLCSAVMNTGYSYFELAIIVMLAESGSRKGGGAATSVSVAYLVLNFSYLLGSLLGKDVASGLAPRAIVEAAVLIVLIIISIVLFDERHIAEFLLDGTPSAQHAPIIHMNYPGGAGAESDPLASFGLTEREQKIAKLYIAGRSAAYIGETLFISPHTVRSHVAHIYEKCGVHSRQELMSLVEITDS